MVVMAKTDWMVYKGLVELLAGMEEMEKGETRESKAHLDLPAQIVVELSTRDGVGQCVPVRKEHSCSMQEDLVELITTSKEEQPMTSACQKTRSIQNYMQLEYRVQA